jgi:clan AA aspartic protease
MGYVYTNVEITNITGDGGCFARPFLVDTGAYDTVVPADELEKIGVTRESKETYKLADGSCASFDLGYAMITINGRKVPGMVVFGKKGSEPLLGVVTLEAARFIVDPVSQKLVEGIVARL